MRNVGIVHDNYTLVLLSLTGKRCYHFLPCVIVFNSAHWSLGDVAHGFGMYFCHQYLDYFRWITPADVADNLTDGIWAWWEVMATRHYVMPKKTMTYDEICRHWATIRVPKKLRLRQNGRNTLNVLSLNEDLRISIEISLKFVPRRPTHNTSVLV